MEKYLVIDVGGTAIKYALMDKESNFLSQGEVPTPLDSLDSFLRRLDGVVLPVKDEVEGIAMSMPGKIDNKTGYMYTGGALLFNQNQPLGEILKARYNKPVTIENDAKCAALAEAWKGNLKDVDSGAVIILGTGIGGGIILNKEVWRGFKGSAGEISNLPTTYSDLYGKGENWANYNGYKGLTRTLANRRGVPESSINGFDFFDAYHKGDEDAVEIFDNFIDTLVSGIITMQTVLDVEKYCIGGGISAEDCLIEACASKVKEYFNRKPGTPLNLPQIDRCYFKNGANLIGALKTYFNIVK